MDQPPVQPPVSVFKWMDVHEAERNGGGQHNRIDTCICDQLRSEWSLPKSFARTKFRDLALESKTLQEVRLTATYPLRTTRYHWGSFSPYELAETRTCLRCTRSHYSLICVRASEATQPSLPDARCCPSRRQGPGSRRSQLPIHHGRNSNSSSM